MDTFGARIFGLGIFYIPEVTPFYAYIAQGILDFTDGGNFTFGNDGNIDTGPAYQRLDKIIDMTVHLVALQVALEEDREFNDILIYLFLFRLFGVIIFLITKNEKVLALFPEFFSVAYIFFFFLEEFDIELSSTKQFWILIGLFILKIFQEYILHVKGGFRKTFHININ